MPTAQTPLPDEDGHQSDPTALTTQQLWREISHLTKHVDLRFDTIATRFAGMDKAIELLQSRADASPTIAVVDNELKGLKDQLRERFEFIQSQFLERSNQVNIALGAAEKAVEKQHENFSESNAKSELSTTKELDAVKYLIAANTKSIDDKIAALVLRLSEMNGQSAGLAKGWGWIVAGLGFILTIVTIGGAVASFFN